MPEWIHNRAKSLEKDMQKTYGPEKAKQVAFAVATQQSHRLGKSPKKFKSKETGRMERFGTSEGRAVARAKFSRPKKEYQKTAALDPMMTGFFEESQLIVKEAGIKDKLLKLVGKKKKIPPYMLQRMEAGFTPGTFASRTTPKHKAGWDAHREWYNRTHGGGASPSLVPAW
jgi:hypothetical protein